LDFGKSIIFLALATGSNQNMLQEDTIRQGLCDWSPQQFTRWGTMCRSSQTRIETNLRRGCIQQKNWESRSAILGPAWRGLIQDLTVECWTATGH